MGDEIKIVNVEDSFKTLDEEGKEMDAIIYLREKKVGVQVLMLGRLTLACRLCVSILKNGRNTVDCRGDWRCWQPGVSGYLWELAPIQKDGKDIEGLCKSKNERERRQSSSCSMVFFSLVEIKGYGYLQNTVGCGNTVEHIEQQQLWSMEKGAD